MQKYYAIILNYNRPRFVTCCMPITSPFSHLMQSTEMFILLLFNVYKFSCNYQWYAKC